MYVLYTVALMRVSCNQCCNRKAINITYSDYVFIALGTENEVHMHQIVICGLSGSAAFFHIIL